MILYKKYMQIYRIIDNIDYISIYFLYNIMQKLHYFYYAVCEK